MPIQLAKLDRSTVSDVIDLIRFSFVDDDFECMQLKNDSSLKIYAKDVPTKEKIMELLKENNIEFNTFAEKNQKRQTFIVRGLNYGADACNISFIGHALIEIGIDGPIEVNRFITGHMKRNKDSDVLYSTS